MPYTDLENMNQALANLIRHEDTRLCHIRLRELIETEDLIEPRAEDLRLSLTFDPTHGFDLVLDTSNVTVNIPGDLLITEYEEMVWSGFVDNHPEEEGSEEELVVLFEIHRTTCPLCREEYYRIIQKLDEVLDHYLTSYIDDLRFLAEEILEQPSSYISSFEVDVRVNQTDRVVLIVLKMDPLGLDELSNLEIVQYMGQSRIASLLQNLPEALIPHVEVTHDGGVSAFLYPILKHTDLNPRSLEIYIARALLDEDISECDLGKYTLKSKNLAVGTISSCLQTAKTIIDDFLGYGE